MTPRPPAHSTTHALKTLRTHQNGPVLSIELNTPEEGNVVSEAMLDDLQTVLDNQDPALRVLVLTGAGEHFCLGGDRAEFAQHLTLDPTGSGIRGSATKARRVCEALTSNPAVTIARLHGKVIGAGLALALACDLRIGAESTTFRLPELALGLPAAWGGLLPRLLNEVGPARVRELILTGRPFGAAEALDLSILQKAVPEQELDTAVAAWVKPIARRPSMALRVTKTLFNAHAAATRLADTSALDAELMAAVLADSHYRRSTQRHH
jgi:enoyl-CoA hydratase/carnithine racemase